MHSGLTDEGSGEKGGREGNYPVEFLHHITCSVVGINFLSHVATVLMAIICFDTILNEMHATTL